MTSYTLTGPIEKARGVIGREPAPDEYYVLEWDSVGRRGIHMVGVREPLDVIWIADGRVTHRERLEPWTGHAVAPADTVIETGVGPTPDRWKDGSSPSRGPSRG